jgi:DNA polymerase (family 10)
MISNNEVSRLFSLYAELLLVHQQDERLSDLLSGAAYRLRRMETDVLGVEKSALNKLFRPAIVALLEELRTSPTLSDLDELLQLTPAGMFDMMRIKGLGGKKLAVLWHIAKIDTAEDLLVAAKAGRVSKIPGFGAKTEKNIIGSIEALNSNAKQFHFADVADIAEAMVVDLQKVFGDDKISLCGDIRRHSTTVASIEIITALGQRQFTRKNLKRFLTAPLLENGVTKAHTHDEIPVIIYHTTPTLFYDDLFVRTGSEAHVNKVRARIKGNKSHSSEPDIYKAAKLPFINPELREDVAEWNFGKTGDELIQSADIKGVVHNHTTWSDGVDSLSNFVHACKKKKYEYVVISEHSKNAHYAGGLKPDQVLRQMEAIDQLNKKLAPFKVFKSIECDICVSGELDYHTDLLKQFDLVIISIHQQLKMDEQKATRRLIKAIENHYTTILGHMTGRQLLVRPGYPVDFKKVIDACAANKVVIEINANPYRLDMDWSHIPYALKKGVMISVNPDAHSIHEIDNIRWGVCAARKGGLTKAMTWNAMSLKKVQDWLKRKNLQG